MKKIMTSLGIAAALCLSLGACSPKDVIKLRTYVVCVNHGMTNCKLHVDKNGNGSVTGDRCEEDMPCWVCEKMGNGVCGPVIIDTNHKLVYAKNGTFPYIRVGSTYGKTICVYGNTPNGHGEDTLACGVPSHIRLGGGVHATFTNGR